MNNNLNVNISYEDSDKSFLIKGLRRDQHSVLNIDNNNMIISTRRAWGKTTVGAYWTFKQSIIKENDIFVLTCNKSAANYFHEKMEYIYRKTERDNNLRIIENHNKSNFSLRNNTTIKISAIVEFNRSRIVNQIKNSFFYIDEMDYLDEDEGELLSLFIKDSINKNLNNTFLIASSLNDIKLPNSPFESLIDYTEKYSNWLYEKF